MSESIIQEADRIAGADRSRDYGHPRANHQRIADIWNAMLGPRINAKLDPRDVALLMIGMKLARESNTPKRDNLVDVVGYVKCIDMIDQTEPQPAPLPQPQPVAPPALIDQIVPGAPLWECPNHGLVTCDHVCGRAVSDR